MCPTDWTLVPSDQEGGAGPGVRPLGGAGLWVFLGSRAVLPQGQEQEQQGRRPISTRCAAGMGSRPSTLASSPSP